MDNKMLIKIYCFNMVACNCFSLNGFDMRIEEVIVDYRFLNGFNYC